MIGERSSKASGLLIGCVAGAMLALGGCSSSDENGTDGGSGGRTGSGGQTAQGTGGRSADGSVDAGPVCLSAQYSRTSSFGAIFDGWGVANVSTPSLVPMPGAGPDGGFSGSVVELDATMGSPTPGSAKITVPFNEPGQSMVFAQNYSPGVNMTGTTLSAQIKLDSGLITGPTDMARAFLVVKTTATYNYAPGPSVPLDPTAGWVTLQLNVDAPNPEPPVGYNPCDVREIDIIFETGMGGMYREAVIHIDTISIAPLGGASDGGADATP